MNEFDPKKLHVRLHRRDNGGDLTFPRKYTLTHSDVTGELFLSIGPDYDYKKLSGMYSRLLRDEVLGEWQNKKQAWLDIHCHTSGGLVLGPARWRDSIFKHHMPMVLKALCYGDRSFLIQNPGLQQSPIHVHFHARQKTLDRTEKWGIILDHMPEP